MSGTGYKKAKIRIPHFINVYQHFDPNIDVLTIFGSGNDLTLYPASSFLGDVTDTTSATICVVIGI